MLFLLLLLPASCTIAIITATTITNTTTINNFWLLPAFNEIMP